MCSANLDFYKYIFGFTGPYSMTHIICTVMGCSTSTATVRRPAIPMTKMEWRWRSNDIDELVSAYKDAFQIFKQNPNKSNLKTVLVKVLLINYTLGTAQERVNLRRSPPIDTELLWQCYDLLTQKEFFFAKLSKLSTKLILDKIESYTNICIWHWFLVFFHRIDLYSYDRASR